MAADLYLLDAFQLLGSLADASVDVVITDPPFDARTHANTCNGFTGRREIDFAPFDAEQLRNFVRDAMRVSMRWVLAFCAFEQLGAYQQAAEDFAPGAWVRSGVWTKPDAMPQFSGDRPGQPGEALAIMHRPGKKRWNCNGQVAHWTCNIERTDRVHPTQKPLAIMRTLVEAFSDPGELVLDPFAGSGSTAVACLQTGRRFLGSEIDPTYHAAALDRIAAARSGQSLASHRAGQTVLFVGGR